MEGFELQGIYLDKVQIHEVDFRGAAFAGKTLWSQRPLLQVGNCGREDRATMVFLFDDRSEPMIICGCFEGTLTAFEQRVKSIHKGTFHELEYNEMIEYIRRVWKLGVNTNIKEN